MTIGSYINSTPKTNRKRLIAALLDEGGMLEGTYETVIKRIECPYIPCDPKALCKNADIDDVTDELCFQCKEAWLNKQGVCKPRINKKFAG